MSGKLERYQPSRPKGDVKFSLL